MSTHLTLSEGRENLRLRKLSTGLDVFPPTSRWRKKKWLLHDLPCHVSELFHFCCCLFLIFVFVNSIGERKRFQTESLAWAIRRRDFWFCAGCFIWYWLLFYICVLNKPIFNECFTTSVRVLETKNIVRVRVRRQTHNNRNKGLEESCERSVLWAVSLWAFLWP